MPDLTYPFAGRTDPTGPTPAAVPIGFHQLRMRTDLPPGSFEAAADALLSWRMHGAVPFLRVRPDAPRAVPGVRLTLALGPVRAPCEVVWTVHEENRAGFGYGTLPGHPESGEEAFVVERRPDGSVLFTVHAISRPAAWYARAAGPLGHRLQGAVAKRYAAALRSVLT
ncbi:DUF1990 domain-containing protein [Actinacidiphila acididurans]|nr:DUF1990 domain-containing protein [Actinacidiphila acididurans]